MNAKNITIALVAIIIIAAGGYFIYKSMHASTPAPEQQNTAAGAPADQVQGQEVKVGTGLQAEPGDTVSVLYTGKLTDGTVFDSSAAHGNEPLVFTLGTQNLIAGFQIGVNGMKEGGERLLAIPPALGYGAQEIKDANGKVLIPANSTIVFDVQLVKVQKATSTPAAN